MKKFLVAVVIALMVLAPITVFADEHVPDGEGGRRGKQRRSPVVQIISLTEAELTFLGKDGEENVLALSDDVKYLLVGEDGPVEGDFSSFEVGDWIKINAHRGEDGTLVLNGMVLLPDDFDPENRLARDGFGRGQDGKKPGIRPIVQIISISGSELTFEGRDGEIVTIEITDDTKFIGISEDGPVEASASDVAVGDWVKLNFGRGEEGSPVLKSVVSLPEDFDPENRPERPEKPAGQRFGGEVTAIDGTSITVINKDGESVTIELDADTEFKSKDGIEIGDVVGIIVGNDDGVANLVIEGKPAGKKGPVGNRSPGEYDGPPEHDGYDGFRGPQS